jgi:DNA-binding GntR family transcriptional regulator
MNPALPSLLSSSAIPDSKSPVTRTRMHRSIYSGLTATVLREHIVSGTLAAGVPLVEAALADALGVSRGPVRNALIELEAEGLVRTGGNGRSVVAGFTQEDLTDVLAVRLEIESLAARWGLQRKRDTAGISNAFAEMLSEGSSTTRLADIDLGFHRRLVEFSGSRSLLQSWLCLAPIIHAVITVGNRRLGARDGEADFQRIIESHRPIVKAVAAGDQRRCAKLLAAQFAITAEMYCVDGGASAGGR